MRVDSPGCGLGDVSISGPGCKDGALWLWNSCVEESRGSWVKPCLELGRNEKVLITTLMPACQSPAGLSRPGGRVTADWSEAGWSFRSITESQNNLVVKYESCSRTYFAPKAENKSLKKRRKKPYLSGYHLRENLRLQQDVKADFSLQSRSTNQV